MATLSMTVASDIANAILTYYVRSKELSQSTQDKPLLRELRARSKPFPGGKDNISMPIQINFMSDASDLQGYSEDTSLNFNQAQNLLRCAFPWKEIHWGFEMTWTELKKDGITISANNKESQHKDANVVRIVDSLLSARIRDWMESYARNFNKMLWGDGSADPNQIAGIRSILTETPNTGSTGGVSRDTYPLWRHRALIGSQAITASGENQTLSKTLRSEMRQLTRYGGRPSMVFCGSKFIDTLESEVQDKGVYTQEGFKNEGKTDIGLARISMTALRQKVMFDYDPTLDDLGLSKRCYMIDPNHLMLRPMEGEDNKLITPERPYNYAVFFRSMFFTGGLVADMLNCHGVYEVQ